MADGFFFERGRLLFDLRDIDDPMKAGERSKSAEHGIGERSIFFCDADFEKSQKLKENGEIES